MSTETKIKMGVVEAYFTSEFVPLMFMGRETNDPALRLVGQLIFYTQDKNYIRELISAALPENYQGNTLEEIDAMVDGALEKGFDERKSAPVKTLVAQFLQLLEKENIELFHNQLSLPYITFKELGKGAITYSLKSGNAELKIKGLFYKNFGKAISSNNFKELLDTLQAKAIFEGECKKVELRIARHQDSVLINLCDDDNRVVIIDQNSYKVTMDSPLSFVSPSNLTSMPAPIIDEGDALEDFRKLVGMDRRNFNRALAFIINCLKPEGPYFMLIVEGEQGSGKSELSRMLKMLVDPSHTPKLRLPKSERDLMILAQDTHLLTFDNLSGMSANMSDAFCTLLTGGGYATRVLYSDDESKIFYQTRPIIINGIEGIASRPDLLERSLALKLPTMAMGKRKTEAELNAGFEELKPRLMAKLFDIVACALRNFDEVNTPTSVRMADAAKWLVAAEPATGLPEGTLLEAIENSQKEIIIESMFNNSLATALMNNAEMRGDFDGTVGELFGNLDEYRNRYDRFFPPTAAHLSKALRRMRPALEKISILVEFGPRTRKGQMIKITRIDDAFDLREEDAIEM